MTLRSLARLIAYTFIGMIAGFVASFVVVWFFVDADMVLPYLVLGAFIGAVAGVVFALLTQRAQRL